jgi:hypothetical protein
VLIIIDGIYIFLKFFRLKAFSTPLTQILLNAPDTKRRYKTVDSCIRERGKIFEIAVYHASTKRKKRVEAVEDLDLIYSLIG